MQYLAKLYVYLAIFLWWLVPFTFIFCFIFALRNALRDQFNRNFFLQSIGAALSLFLLVLSCVMIGISS